jgi:hypothetical protein
MLWGLLVSVDWRREQTGRRNDISITVRVDMVGNTQYSSYL